MRDDERAISEFIKEVSALGKLKGILVGWSRPATLESKRTYPESPDEVEIERQSISRIEFSTRTKRHTESVAPETWPET